MNIKLLYTLLAVSLMLFVQGCGGGAVQEADATEEIAQEEIIKTSHMLNEVNYLSLAKYHYAKESSALQKLHTKDSANNSRFRAYPGAAISRSENSHALKITSVTPFDKYVESMDISVDGRSIKSVVKNGLYVTVGLYEADKLLKEEQLTLEAFKSFDLDAMEVSNVQ